MAVREATILLAKQFVLPTVCVAERHAYGSALEEFFCWWEATGPNRLPLGRALICEFREHLRNIELPSDEIAIAIDALRRLAAEAAAHGVLPQETAEAIATVR